MPLRVRTPPHPLLTMTQEEREELWQLVFKKTFENGSTLLSGKEGSQSDPPRWVLMSGTERLGIEFNGNVWADSDMQPLKYNQHEVTRWFLSRSFDIFGLAEAMEKQHEDYEHLYGLPESNSVSHVRPRVRPTQTITEAERKELWQVVFNKPFGNGNSFFLGKEGSQSDPARWVMASGAEQLVIELNGHVRADSDLQPWNHNQHEVSKWFLSRSFDVFGLIEAGLAIEMDTKNNN